MILCMSTADQSLIPAVTLGWRIRMAIEFADVKVQDIADELDVSRNTVGRWMHDTGKPPRDGFVKLIALRTGVPYEWIRYGVEAPETGPEQGFPQRTCFADVVPFRARRSSQPALGAAA